MNVDTRKQLVVFLAFLLTNVLLAFLALAIGLPEPPLAQQGQPPSFASAPLWVQGLANGGIILVVYGVLGLAGLWFARRLDIPGVYREGAGWREWLVIPMGLGAAVGTMLVVLDQFFASFGDWGGFPHPPFPLSLIASGAAGIGEEIIFRMFVLGLWAFLLNLALKRRGDSRLALWGGNVIAALAFGAGHLPATMMLLDVTTLGEIPALVLAELFLLNGLVGLVAGERYIRQGLVAAAGVHFWADIVWHVLFGLA
jgi:membrane protease YdiL (CAAX protease family)